MQKLTPSRIARAYASQSWPDVQSQRKLAPGVFDFSCAGHGGIVAVVTSTPRDAVAVAQLGRKLVDIAREQGKTELVGLYHGRLITSERYTRDTFERMREAHMPVFEVWAGEEDCDWALIALASFEVCRKLSEKWTGKSALDVVQYAKENAQRWNPEFLAAVAETEFADLYNLAEAYA